MTNKEAKDVLQEQIDRYGQEYDAEGIEALETAIKVLEQTRWIPVSEKLPPIAQRVLVSATNGEVFIARYHSFGKWTFEPTGFSYAYNKGSIIKWMPLPQPYEVESGVRND